VALDVEIGDLPPSRSFAVRSSRFIARAVSAFPSRKRAAILRSRSFFWRTAVSTSGMATRTKLCVAPRSAIGDEARIRDRLPGIQSPLL
jgi:hypothetical protein